LRLLLDTHIAVWAMTNSPKLSGHARMLIADPSNGIVVSVASLWEIAIKFALKRGAESAIPLSALDAAEHLDGAGYEVLDIKPAHVVALESLPLLHGDPFDRMLVAQALAEPLRLLTHDARVAAYSDSIIEV
jgi:PIN domain nuclease of toxin-antitoxin system